MDSSSVRALLIPHLFFLGGTIIARAVTLILQLDFEWDEETEECKSTENEIILVTLLLSLMPDIASVVFGIRGLDKKCLRQIIVSLVLSVFSIGVVIVTVIATFIPAPFGKEARHLRDVLLQDKYLKVSFALSTLFQTTFCIALSWTVYYVRKIKSRQYKRQEIEEKRFNSNRTARSSRSLLSSREERSPYNYH